MKSKWLERTAIGLLMALVGYAGYQYLQRQWAQQKELRHQLLAAQDTSRILTTHIGVVTNRLALIIAGKEIELDATRDSLAKAAQEGLRLRRALAKAAVRLEVSADTSVGQEVHPDSGGILPGTPRSDTLRLDKPPVTGHVAVRGVFSGPNEWSWKLTPAPIPLLVTVACGKTGPEIVAATPEWAKADIGQPSVSQDVCRKRGSSVFTKLFIFGAGLATGVIGWELIR